VIGLWEQARPDILICRAWHVHGAPWLPEPGRSVWAWP